MSTRSGLAVTLVLALAAVSAAGGRAEALQVQGRERRLGVHRPPARGRPTVRDREGRAQLRQARREAVRAQREGRRHAVCAEHVLRADSACVPDHDRAKRRDEYPAQRHADAAGARRRDFAQRRRRGSVDAGLVRLRVPVPARRSAGRASARPAVPVPVRQIDRVLRFAGVPRYGHAYRAVEPVRDRLRDADRHAHLCGTRRRRDRDRERLLRGRRRRRKGRTAGKRRPDTARRWHDVAVRPPELELDSCGARPARRARRIHRRLRQHGIQHRPASALRRAAQPRRRDHFVADPVRGASGAAIAVRAGERYTAY